MIVSDMFGEINWGAFLIALMVVELTPGPNMGWLAALSAKAGKTVGMKAVAGVTLGLTIQMLAAAFGLSAILAGSSVLYEILRWGGVAFMLYLAWESWVESGQASPAQTDGSQNFYRGLAANLLNPKALVFYIAVVSQFADPSASPIWLQTIVLGTVHLVIAFAIHVAVVLAASHVTSGLDRWRQSLGVRVMFAMALVLIAVWIAFSTRL